MAKTWTKAEESGLTAAQERALVMLLSSPTHEMAAEKAGITSRTLHRYLRTPEFRAEYLARRREMLSSAVSLAQQCAVDMAAVQISIAKDAAMPPSVRVAAANNIFSIAMGGLQEDLEERIVGLEERIHELGLTSRTNGTGARRLRCRRESMPPFSAFLGARQVVP